MIGRTKEDKPKKYETPQYIPSNPNAKTITETELLAKLDTIFKYNAKKIKDLTQYSYENIEVYTKYVELIRMLMFFNTAYTQFLEKGTAKDEEEVEK